MRVVITGGAGFLGSHFCDALLGAGHQICCIDNLITGRRENISHLEGNPNFQFDELDLTENPHVESPVDAVMHFASPASPMDYLRLPIETLKVGAFGTYNALELAKAHGARFLLASTSEVYGDPLVNPQSEEYWGNVNAIGPRGVYDEAKRFAEAITFAFRRAHGVDTRIARIFNTFGPRMRPNDGRVISNLIVQALQGEDLTIYGDGCQTRSFCYVSDMVEGIKRLLLLEWNSKTGTDVSLHDENYGPVNLGNPNELSILEIAEIILRLTQSRSRLVHKPLPLDDPKVRRPDIARAHKLIDWTPKVTLEEGLRMTVDHFRSVLRQA